MYILVMQWIYLKLYKKLVMKSVNKVILIGNSGKNAEVKGSGDNKIAIFSLATSLEYKNKNGELIKNTQWHNIVTYNKLAEIVGNYVKRGTKLYLEGYIKYGSYDDSNGNKKYTTDIVCEKFIFLDSKSENNSSNSPDLPF